MKKIFIFSLAALFLLAAFMILQEVLQQEKDRDRFEELAELVAVEPMPLQENAAKAEEIPETEPATESVPALRDLTPLFDRNADCVGWLQITGTQVNYPVMHTPRDPERYLHKNFDGEYSPSGVPFLDGNCTLESQNRIFYGHNMKNGTMFAEITNYRDPAYRQAHPVVELQTAEGISYFMVFAVVQVKNTDDWYWFYGAEGERYDSAVAQMQERALYDTGITPQTGTPLLTLSTCYGPGSDDRILVIAAQMNQP